MRACRSARSCGGVLETGSNNAAPTDAARPAAGTKVPATLRDPGAIRFWIAIVLTGFCAGLGAALLTMLFDAAQEFAWGAASPSALLEAAWQASPARHVGLLVGAGVAVSVSQWLPPSTDERQQHRRHGGDLVSGGPHAAGENARQRSAIDRDRRHGRSARPRRRPQAIRRCVRQRLLDPPEAVGRTAPLDRRHRRRRWHGRGL